MAVTGVAVTGAVVTGVVEEASIALLEAKDAGRDRRSAGLVGRVVRRADGLGLR